MVMAIFKAIGFGILLLILQCFLPAVLHQAEATLLAFLRGAEVSANSATTLVASVGTLSKSETLRLPQTTPGFALPQAAQIRGY